MLFVLIGAVYIINIAVLPTSVSAQSNQFLGINITQSTNYGNVGLTPNFEVVFPQKERLTFDLKVGAFIGLLNESRIPRLENKYHHLTVNTDVGYTYTLVDSNVDWYIGTGPSVRIGSRKHVASATFYRDELHEFDMYKDHFIWIGYFVKSSVAFNEKFRLNLTFQGYPASYPYLSIGSSFDLW
jgi:hypothetical protein